MVAIGWLRDLLIPASEPAPASIPCTCSITYANGSSDRFHYWAKGSDDALQLAALGMPKREAPAREILITMRPAP